MTPWCLIFATLVREQVLAVQRASLDDAGLRTQTVQITLKGAGPDILRPGTLRFPWSGLAKPSIASADSVLVWRGELVSENGKVIPVWTRVQMTVTRTGVVSARPIPAGKPITAESLRISTWNASVFQNAPLQQFEALIGATLSRSVPIGTPLLAEMVADRGRVLAGDRIRVESIAGGARVAFDAIAENRAGLGERVYFRNPLNGRRVAGRADAGHRVVISWGNEQ